MVGGGGCIARADVHDDGPAADTAAVRRQIATKANAACNPRIIVAIAFVGHERSERPSDTRAVLFARRRRAARDETSSSLVKSVTRKRIRVGNARRIVHHERRKRCAFRPRPEAADALHAPRAGGSRAADSPQKRVWHGPVWQCSGGPARVQEARGVWRMAQQALDLCDFGKATF